MGARRWATANAAPDAGDGRQTARPLTSWWSGFDVRYTANRDTAKRTSNPKLHQNSKFSGGPLILTFANCQPQRSANVRIGPPDHWEEPKCTSSITPLAPARSLPTSRWRRP